MNIYVYMSTGSKSLFLDTLLLIIHFSCKNYTFFGRKLHKRGNSNRPDHPDCACIGLCTSSRARISGRTYLGNRYGLLIIVLYVLPAAETKEQPPELLSHALSEEAEDQRQSKSASEEAPLVSERRPCVAQLSARCTCVCASTSLCVNQLGGVCIYCPRSPEVRADCLDKLRVVNETPLKFIWRPPSQFPRTLPGFRPPALPPTCTPSLRRIPASSPLATHLS